MNDELSIQEVCERLHFAASTVIALCVRGDLAGAYQDEQQQWHIPHAAVREWQQRQLGQHNTTIPWQQWLRGYLTRKRLAALLVALGTAVLMILRLLVGSGLFGR